MTNIRAKDSVPNSVISYHIIEQHKLAHILPAYHAPYCLCIARSHMFWGSYYTLELQLKSIKLLAGQLQYYTGRAWSQAS